jgi:hypothetical protein
MKVTRTVFSLLLYVIYVPFCSAIDMNKQRELQWIYQEHCATPSDINEHLPQLKKLASECSSSVEIGLRGLASTSAILQGLSENNAPFRSYVGIDLEFPSKDKLQQACSLAESQGISFQFLQGNDMKIDIDPVDLLFIDSLHTYCHLTNELEKFSPKVRKYIALHHTSSPWDMEDDDSYQGDYSEYNLSIDRAKRGLWPAVLDFLQNHPEWSLFRRHNYNHGFTVLKRIEKFENSDIKIEYAIKNKIILCTGPSFNRKAELKGITENDLKFIPFKKIYVGTHDPRNSSVVFNEQRPFVEVFPGQNHNLDCANCMLSTIYAAVNDASSSDDDIILFKHETVFVNDMNLFGKAIAKILEGYDAIVRCDPVRQDHPMTDVFLIKVSSARRLLKQKRFLTKLQYDCETYFREQIFNRLRTYRIHRTAMHHHEDTELGFFHVRPGTGSVRGFSFWDMKNYGDLYR